MGKITQRFNNGAKCARTLCLTRSYHERALAILYANGVFAMIKTLTFNQMKSAVEEAYTACKDMTGGQNAHYIPYLANIDSNLFGMSLCLPDGALFPLATPITVWALSRCRKCILLFWCFARLELKNFSSKSGQTQRDCLSTRYSPSFWRTITPLRRS